jgi:hypothetical protein
MGKIYKLKNDGFKIYRLNFIIRIIPIYLIIAIFSFLISVYKNNNFDFSYDNMISTLIMLSLLIIIFVIVTFRFINNLKGLYNSIELIIDNNCIIRKQKNKADIIIKKEEIVEIVEKSDKSLFIKTNSNKILTISYLLIDFEDLKNELAIFKEIQTKKVTNSYIYIILITFCMLLLMFFFYTSSTKFIIIFSGILLFTICFLSLIFILTNKRIDKRIKYSSLSMFILLLSIILKIFIVLK